MLNTSTSNITQTRKTDDGFQVGRSATDLVGFHGSTPVAQKSSVDQDAVAATAATDTTPFGFSETQANAIVTLLNEIRSALVEKGIIKGSV